MKANQRKIGVILSYLSEAIKILTGLVYTPVMLSLLGQSEYGLYQLVYSVVSYLSLLSLGFGSSYMRYYSRYKADNDDKAISRLNGMFLIIFCTMSIICILCGAVMVGNVSLIFGTGLSAKELEKAKVLMSIMVVNLAITFPNSVFNCSVTAHEQFVFQKSVIVLQSLLSPFLTLPLLIMGFGSVGMVSITTILTLGVFVSNMLFCLKKLKIKFAFKGIKFSLLKEMWIFTFFIFFNQIIDQINWSIDKFLLGRLAGTAAVAVYGVGGQINSMYLQFSTAISNVFVPEINRLVAEKDDDSELSKLFTKVGRIQFVIMALILSGFVFFGQPFIRVWAGAEYSDSYYVTLLLIAPVTIPLIQNLGIELQRAKNKHKTRSVVYFCIAIINVFISIPLIKVFGPAGAACGTAIGLVAGNVLFMNWYYHKKIGLDMLYFWKNILGFFPALIAPCVVGILLMGIVQNANVGIMLLCIMLYVFVYCGSMWKFGMNEYEKNLIVKPVKKVINLK